MRELTPDEMKRERELVERVETGTPISTEPKKKEDMAKRLIGIGMEGTKLFHDVDGTGYVVMPEPDEGDKIFPIMGTDIREMMSQIYFKKYRRAPSDKATKEAIGVLNGTAKFDKEEIRLHNRVAWRGGDIVYDMSNKDGEEVIIGVDGWGTQKSAFPTFKRHPHQSAQTRPTAGGDINEIFNIINVVDSDRLLTLVHLISSLIPDIPHPMVVLGGEQGSAKSSASKMFKALIDPSMIDTVAMPRNADRMHQVLSKHWYLMFDNVSWIQDWQSDLFCRAVTGQADVTREYYTTSDDHIVSYKMCLGMNGITSLVTSADLLDRTLMIRLNPITDDARRSEEDINNEFEMVQGAVLGAMFDVLGRAIAIYPTVSLKGMPRMADFAKWGCAISEALGHTQDDFMRAYGEKIDAANEDAIEATPVAGLIIRLMDDQDVWTGSPKELWLKLLEYVADDGMNKGDVRGMKNVWALGKARERIGPNLRRFGIDWRMSDRTNTKRGYRIEKHLKNGGKKVTFGDIGDMCTPHVIPPKNNVDMEGGNTIGAQTSQTNQTSQQSKRLDLDQSTYPNLWADPNAEQKLQHAIGKAMGKTNRPDVDGVMINEAHAEHPGVSMVVAQLNDRGDALGITRNAKGLYRITI